MLEPFKKKTAEEYLAKTQSFVNTAISFLLFTEEQPIKTQKFRIVNRNGETGAAMKLTDSSGDGCDLTIFPIGRRRL